ncbi:MAG: hypothetical protein R2849_03870 [Thermomicrobiales bacterium]
MSRIYQADLDDDGRIRLSDHGAGAARRHGHVDYYNMDTGQADARVTVDQNAEGYYDTYNVTPYYEGAQGVPPYEEQAGQPDYDVEYDAQYVYSLLPDGLPPSFEGGHGNPEYILEYNYHHSETYGDVTVHLFDHAGRLLRRRAGEPGRYPDVVLAR